MAYHMYTRCYRRAEGVVTASWFLYESVSKVSVAQRGLIGRKLGRCTEH